VGHLWCTRPATRILHPDQDKRGKHVAAVATARKLAVIIWHILSKDEDYTGTARHSCNGSSENSSSKPVIRLAAAVARKDRAAYSNKSVRDSERETIANARMNTALRRDLETAIAKGALGRHKGGATIIGCATGLEPRPCSLPRGRPSRHSVT